MPQILLHLTNFTDILSPITVKTTNSTHQRRPINIICQCVIPGDHFCHHCCLPRQLFVLLLAKNDIQPARIHCAAVNAIFMQYLTKIVINHQS